MMPEINFTLIAQVSLWQAGLSSNSSNNNNNGLYFIPCVEYLLRIHTWVKVKDIMLKYDFGKSESQPYK